MPGISKAARRRGARALIGALLAAGCGSNSPSTTTTTTARPLSRAELVAAIAATRAVASAHETLTLALAGPSGSLHFSVDGLADFRTTTGTTTVTSSQGQREQAVFQNGTVWLTDNAPAFTRLLPNGQRWVRSTASALEAIGAFTRLSHSMAILDVLRGITSLHSTGARSATFTFSMAQALARTPAAMRAALHSAIHTTGNTPVRSYGSLSLDSGGRVRALSVVMAGIGNSSGLFLGYALSITDVGAPVRVTPPASSVPLSSLPRLAALLRGSATGT